MEKFLDFSMLFLLLCGCLCVLSIDARERPRSRKTVHPTKPLPDYIKKYPRRRDLLALCPGERRSCPSLAIRGRCAGGRLSALRVRERRCPCTCGSYLQIRAQACCAAYTPPEYAACVDICRYNTTSDELYKRMECLEMGKFYHYCLWDGSYDRKCCMDKGFTNKCADIFCQGGAFPCDPNIGLPISAECKTYHPREQQCQLASIKRKPNWKKNHKHAECIEDFELD